MPFDPETPENRKFLAELRERNLAIAENIDKLHTCPRHKFEGQYHVTLSPQRFRCMNCQGEMEQIHISQYIRGYEAHGGDGNDIWDGWR